ncbi:hypothetical protein BDF20DRAFT_889025 [Mycotypha africana]|uniref:uncharacterized protein n=1 Tax=Mycotypha africana TaxID=64632 RepID=UPI002301A03F|nr:uncharacterized protein BDF20DRAFT_889025 [Mycotypha africana]KAI8970047.1 hypothetical protein BDF20DRAFT_889025 [Mycotypha africana]
MLNFPSPSRKVYCFPSYLSNQGMSINLERVSSRYEIKNGLGFPDTPLYQRVCENVRIEVCPAMKKGTQNELVASFFFLMKT